MKANPSNSRKASGKAKDKKPGVSKPAGFGNQKSLEAEFSCGGSSALSVGPNPSEFGFGPSGSGFNMGTPSSTDAFHNVENKKLIKPISGLDFPNEDLRMFADTIQKVSRLRHLMLLILNCSD
jgi:hypothetical protein